MLANFIPATGCISLVGITIPGISILDGVAWVLYRHFNGNLRQVNLIGTGCVCTTEQLSDVHGNGRQQFIRSPFNREGIELSYRINNYDHHPFLLFQLSIHNRSTQPVFLKEICLFQSDPALGGRMDMPDPGSELRFFKVGWHGWAYSGLRTPRQRDASSWLDSITNLSYSNPVTPNPRRRGEFWSETWGILASEKVAMLAGFASTDHQFGQVYVCTRRGAEAIKLTTQADGIRLDPGDTCDSEWAYLQFITLPNPAPAADYIDAVARQMQSPLPLSPPPPMWTHWYRYYHKISEKLLLQNVDALAKARELIPFQVIELDDGYQSAWGDWSSTNSKFPHGLEHLANQITLRGFTPGLWLAPLVVEAKSQVAREHSDWLVRDQHGRPINAGFFYNRNFHALDASHPEVLDYLRQLVDIFVHRWGYGMLKIDFLNTGALPGKRYNPKLTRAECLRLGLETIRQAAGENAYLLASGCPFGPAIGLVDAVRIGPDTAPSWEPNLHWLAWARPFFKHNPSMPSLRNAFRHTLNLSALHQRWWWNDPDCLLVRDRHTHLTKAEVQSSVTLVGLSGGMLVSSDDVGRLNPERLHWISLLIPNLGMRGLPVDWLENEMPTLYQVQMNPGRGIGQSWHLVGLFNWRERKAGCWLQFARLGYVPGSALHVFDFWTGRYQRVTKPELVFPDVPAHGCKLLRLCPVAAGPQLVGDTLHVSQGAELSSWVVDSECVSIETIDLGRKVQGDLWLSLPKAPIEATCNDAPVSSEAQAEGIYVLHLHFNGKATIKVRF